MKAGSLFSGYGGLDMAVAEVLDTEAAWFAENEPGPAKVLAHHWPGVPNLGDITRVDWSAVEPVDILTGGFPCQDISAAGKRVGLVRRGDRNRSGLWAVMAEAIDVLRPRLVVVENVRGLLSAKADASPAVFTCAPCVDRSGGFESLGMRALGAVLGDLAELGYDAAWQVVRASDIGAPHQRARVILVAWPADAGREYGERRASTLSGGSGARGSSGEPERPAETTADTDRLGHERGGDAWGRRDGPADDGHDAAHTDRTGLAQRSGVTGDDGSQRAPAQRGHRDDGCIAPDATRDGRHEGWAESAGIVGGHDAAECGGSVAPDSDGGERDGWQQVPERIEVGRVTPAGAGADVRWGQFEPAIRRWERLTRPAPAPTETGSRGGQRLSPRFVEWMMGLPDEYVTGVPGLSRNDQLKALGNGVVPQQMAHGLRTLLLAVGTVAA